MEDQQLTPHFCLSEFITEGDVPPAQVLENLHRLAEALEKARALLGVPICITSGYRSPAHNQAVGGVKHSFHMKGLAVDCVPVELALLEAYHKLDGFWQGGLGLYSHHLHLDLGPSGRRWKSLAS